MIHYFNKSWAVQLIMQYRGSALPPSIPVALTAGILTVGATYLIEVTTDGDEVSEAKTRHPYAIRTFAQVLGFIVAFRTNIAYGRYEEGMEQLELIASKWVDCFSMMTGFINVEKEFNKDPVQQQQLHDLHNTLYHWFTLMSAIAVQMLLGQPVDVREFRHEPIMNRRTGVPAGAKSDGRGSYTALEDADIKLMSKITPFDPEESTKPLVMGPLVSSEKLLNTCHDPSLQVALWIMEAIARANTTGLIMVDPPILSRVYQELTNGALGVTHAQKITIVSFPFPFAQIVSVMIFLVSFAVPVVVASTIGRVNTAFAAIAAFFVCAGYAGVNRICLELEGPFGTDANDLPLKEFHRFFVNTLSDILLSESRRGFTPSATAHTSLAPPSREPQTSACPELESWLLERKLAPFSKRLSLSELKYFTKQDLIAKFGIDAAIPVLRQIQELAATESKPS